MSIPSYITSIITAVAKIEQGVAAPKFIMGGFNDDGDCFLFKKGDVYTFAIWRSAKYKIGRPFKINEIKIPLSNSIASNISIIPVIQFDDENTSKTGITINPTNYPDSDKFILLTPDNFSQGLSGKKNFYLELQFTGTALVGVTFPISIELELLETL